MNQDSRHLHFSSLIGQNNRRIWLAGILVQWESDSWGNIKPHKKFKSILSLMASIKYFSSSKIEHTVDMHFMELSESYCIYLLAVSLSKLSCFLIFSLSTSFGKSILMFNSAYEFILMTHFHWLLNLMIHKRIKWEK